MRGFMKKNETARMKGWLPAVCMLIVVLLTACERQPMLYLHENHDVKVDMAMVQLDLNVYWKYDIDYDWRAEWTYGWNDNDRMIFGGEIGYKEPTDFILYPYFLGTQPGGHHGEDVPRYEFSGRTFTTKFNTGYYDVLVRNNLGYLEQQALYFETHGDSMLAFTQYDNMMARYTGRGFSQAYAQPEELFSAYARNTHISENPADYDYYDPETNTYYKNMGLDMHPVTYIYLTQIRLHNNNGKIDRVLGKANLNGVAKGVCLNSGIADSEPVTVGYLVRMKNGCTIAKTGEKVDVIGGRCLTFGIPSQNSSRVSRAQVRTDERQYIDLDVTFYNGMDSTMVFDVTDQVHKMYRGGVITIDIDMNDVPVPVRPGGSGFDAVVKEFDEETHYIEI